MFRQTSIENANTGLTPNVALFPQPIALVQVRADFQAAVGCWQARNASLASAHEVSRSATREQSDEWMGVADYIARSCRRSCRHWDTCTFALTFALRPAAGTQADVDFAAASSFRVGPGLANLPPVRTECHCRLN
jgi:hypothetical protein